MWRLVRQESGEVARPRFSRIVGPTANIERFANWFVKDTTTGVEVLLRIYLPLDPSTCNKVIFSIPGIKRNARKYCNIFVNYVQDKNVMIVAPDFRDNSLKGDYAISMGNMFYSKLTGEQRPPELWTFNMIDSIFKLIATKIPSITKYSVFGHSAGAQFAHRLAIVARHPEIDAIVAANPGWLTVLDKNVRFPFGVKDCFSDDELRRILNERVIILSGEEDKLADDHLRTSTRAMVQGKNRFERAQYAIAQAQRLAKELNVDCNWQQVVVRGVGHSSNRLVSVGLKYLI